MDWILVIILFLTGLHMHKLGIPPVKGKLIDKERLSTLYFMENRMIVKDTISQYLNSTLLPMNQRSNKWTIAKIYQSKKKCNLQEKG